MVYSAYNLNKQGDNIQPCCTPFPILNQSVIPCLVRYFLTRIQVSQETDKIVWYSHLFKNFPQFVVIHTVKGFWVVSETEVDVFLKFLCFLYDPMWFKVWLDVVVASLIAQMIKNPPAIWETWVQPLGWEDPLEKGKATHSSILAWRIPWTVQSMGSQRVGHDWATFTFTFLIRPALFIPRVMGVVLGVMMGVVVGRGSPARTQVISYLVHSFGFVSYCLYQITMTIL